MDEIMELLDEIRRTCELMNEENHKKSQFILISAATTLDDLLGVQLEQEAFDD